MNSKLSETDKQLSSKTPSEQNRTQISENLSKLILLELLRNPKMVREQLLL